MFSIPKDLKSRKALLTYWELRKTAAEALRAEADNANHLASASVARVYTFYGDVDEENIRACMAELGVWSREFPGQSLNVVFNTPGGTLVDGRALYDYLLHLRSQGHHLTTLGLGQVSSMGAVLLQAGEIRVIGPNAWMLLHEASSEFEGTKTNVKRELAQLEREDDQMLRILTERAKMTPAELSEKIKSGDLWLDAKECVEWGFADEILAPKHMAPPKRRHTALAKQKEPRVGEPPQT
jgi:ATP-dependent protease ClpP protease subunit